MTGPAHPSTVSSTDSTDPTPSDPPSETVQASSSPAPAGSADTSASNAPGAVPTGASATTEPVPGLTDQPSATYQQPTEPSSGSASAGAPAPNPDTTAAVQTALGAEYGAVWTYTLITAFLSADLQARAQQDVGAHRARRDYTIRLLTDYGVAPEPAEPAYRTPASVTDSNSAVRLAVSAESDASAAWRSVLERCDDSGLRRVALDGLTDSAVRGAHWSDRLANRPVVSQFPGGSGAA